MAELKEQYEAFCLLYLQFANAGSAAHSAGYSYENRYQTGARLLQRPEIIARIQELRAAIVERECLSVETLLAKLETAFGRAIESNNALAAVRVIELQARLIGLIGKSPLDGVAQAAVTEEAQAEEPDSDGTDGENVGDDDADEGAVAAVPSPSPSLLPAPPASTEAMRAALAAVARSRARKRQRASAR